MSEPWPRRPSGRHPPERVARITQSAVKRLPVTARGPKVVPVPTLTPKSRRDAAASAVVLVLVALLVLALLAYSVAHLQQVNVTGKVFVGTIIGLTLIALALYVISLGLYVLPVLFGVRKPSIEPPPTWPGVGDRHH